MKLKNRSIGTCIILSLVTCGIYALYWAFCLAKEQVTFANEKDDALLESLLMIFFAPIGIFLTEKKFAEGCKAQGIEHEDKSVIYLVMSLFGFALVALAMMQNECNKLAPANAE